MLYRRLARPLLFRLEAERAHELAVTGLSRGWRALPRVPRENPLLAQDLMGCHFPNPVGLAAGFDKYARAVAAWPRLGFGFAEIGTITWRPQPGNPRPRIFRLPDDRALINRLGFNNHGAGRTAGRLAGHRRRGHLGRVPLGINLGKSKLTPPEEAPADYAESLKHLWPYADYVVVNVSSPNTPGLRDLQEKSELAGILDALAVVNGARAEAAGGEPLPLLVKLAPDLEPAQLDAIVDLALARELAGLIISNTTIARDGLASPTGLASETGGLSGGPLRERSTQMLARARHRAGDRLVLIGVGGIFTAEDAWSKITAGASLVQVYTGFVYGGPGTARRIADGLAERVHRAGLASISAAVGTAADGDS